MWLRHGTDLEGICSKCFGEDYDETDRDAVGLAFLCGIVAGRASALPLTLPKRMTAMTRSLRPVKD